MTDLAHGLWAAATCSIAFGGAKVAITWINQRERKAVRDEQRDERDAGVVAQCRADVEALRADVKALSTEQKLFIANARGSR